jgi:hypothetical protein
MVTEDEYHAVSNPRKAYSFESGEPVDISQVVEWHDLPTTHHNELQVPAASQVLTATSEPWKSSQRTVMVSTTTGLQSKLSANVHVFLTERKTTSIYSFNCESAPSQTSWTPQNH